MNLKRLSLSLEAHSPGILAASGIAGFISATVMAAKAAPVANDILDANQPFIAENGLDKFKDEAKLVGRIYIPTVGMLMVSSALVMTSVHISNRRYAAVSSLLLATQAYLQKVQENMLEIAGPKKTEEILSKSAQPRTTPPMALLTGDSVLCYDLYSDRYFTMDSVEDVKRAVNEINELLYSDMFVSINEFYERVGLAAITYGDDIGWDVENGMVNLRLDSMLTDKDKPCVVIVFEATPKHFK